MYPLKFEKVFKKKIWGGQKFATELDIKLPDGDKYGESWELCSRASGVSRIMNGPLKGKTLEDVYQEYGGELVGEEVYLEFPISFLCWLSIWILKGCFLFGCTRMINMR